MKKVLSSLIVIGVIGSAAVGLSSAFFSDSETSQDNSFVAGELDLKIDSLDNPPALINVTDLKPGDNIFEDKILKIIDNPAFVWMHIKDLVDGQGTPTDSENDEETLLGGPKSDIQNYLTYDLSVEDEVIIDFDDDILLPDAVSCWIPLGELPGNIDVTVTQSFHFDESVTDWAQGDTLTFTEEFYATQTRNNPNASPPDLGSGRTWSNELKSCVSDLSNKNNLTFTCTSGCSGVFPHTINMGPPDISTGNFTGNGFYNPNPAYTWDVTGNTSGISFTANILYTGLNPGYFVDLIGTIDGSGNVAGTAVSSAAQTFTFVIN